jgi:hypothetical protein
MSDEQLNKVVEPTCGEGVIQPGLGEACDYCSADCTQELAWCGDGTLQESAGDTDTHWCSCACWFQLAKDWDSEASDAGP